MYFLVRAVESFGGNDYERPYIFEEPTNPPSFEQAARNVLIRALSCIRNMYIKPDETLFETEVGLTNNVFSIRFPEFGGEVFIRQITPVTPQEFVDRFLQNPDIDPEVETKVIELLGQKSQ